MLRAAAPTLLGVALQGLAQAITLLTGLLIIRMLTLDEYALYTLAAATLGAANSLADSGLVNAVMARAGRVWRDGSRLGSVLAQGLSIRSALASVVAAIATPVLLALILRHESSLPYAVAMCLAFGLMLFVSVPSTILEIPLRLHQRLSALQSIQVKTSVLRLACVALSLVTWPLAWLTLVSGVIPQLFLNWRLRQQNCRITQVELSPTEDSRTPILRQVGRAMPATVYYVFSSQLVIVLISLFGSTQGVAQVGALSRLGLLVGFLLIAFQMIAVPRYARIESHDTRLLARMYLGLLTGLALASGLLVLLIWAMPSLVTLILGSNYASLAHEATLATAASALSMVAVAAGSMAAVRGVVVSPYLFVPAGLIVQIGLVIILPLDSVASMFWIGIGFSAVHAGTSIANFLWSIRGASGRAGA